MGGVSCISTEQAIKLKSRTPEQIYDICNDLRNRGRQQQQTRRYDATAFAIEQMFIHKNMAYFYAINQMKFVPVTMEEFIDSDEYMGNIITLWDALRKDLLRMQPDQILGGKPILEVLLGGATGAGKSYLVQCNILYTLYFLSCFPEPQLLFSGLNRMTPLVVALQSVQERVTKRVLYNPIREAFLSMPFVKKWIKYDKYNDSVLYLENKVELVPALADTKNVLGSAVIAAALDEINFMQVVEESKRVAGPRGQGGKFDQADLVYRNLTRRRKSRFITKGLNPGGLYVSSSVHYQDDFLDRRIKEVEQLDDNSHIIVWKKKQFEVQPPERFSGKTFRFLVGTDDYGSRVLHDTDKVGTHYPENARIEIIPIEYKEEFMFDPENAQRDILGVASHALCRFISQIHKVVDAIQRGKETLIPYVFKQNVILAEDGMPQVNEKMLPRDLDTPRFVHIDLSISGDRCGIAIVKVKGHKKRINEHNLVEALPYIQVESAISIAPSPTHHIDIAEVRRWVINLKEHYGMNIACVTYDGFQSRESVQMLITQGIHAYTIAPDKGLEMYENLRRMIYEDRLDLVDNPEAKLELISLEYHAEKKKIEHPTRAKGHGDIADAICCATYAASHAVMTRRKTGVVNEEPEPIVEKERELEEWQQQARQTKQIKIGSTGVVYDKSVDRTNPMRRDRKRS